MSHCILSSSTNFGSQTHTSLQKKQSKDSSVSDVDGPAVACEVDGPAVACEVDGPEVACEVDGPEVAFPDCLSDKACTLLLSACFFFLGIDSLKKCSPSENEILIKYSQTNS